MHPSDSYRIVHIAPRLRYGAGRYLLDTAIAQHRRDPGCVAVVIGEDLTAPWVSAAPLIGELRAASLPVLRAGNLFERAVPQLRAAAAALRAAVLPEGLDWPTDAVVHAHAPMAAVVARWAGAPHVVLTVHGWGPGRPGDFDLEDALATSVSDVILAPCERWASLLRQRTGRPSIPVVPYGLDLERCAAEERPVTAGPVRILNVGELSVDNGVDLLLEAMPIVWERFPDAQLHFIGEGELGHRLWQRAGVLDPSGSRVVFHGLIDQPTVFLRDFDIFALPCRAENEPWALLEAMTVGLPIVATRVPAIPELIETARCGFLVAPGDAVELATTLRTLIEAGPVVRNLLGGFGSGYARTTRGIAAHIAELDTWYRRTTAQRRAAPAPTLDGPVRLHMGCANGLRAGWLNIDARADLNPDIVARAHELAAFGDGSVDAIEASHLLQNLPPHEARLALREWARVLRAGGELLVELPDFEACVALLRTATDDRARDAAMMGIFGFSPGVERYGDAHAHHWGWSPRSLTVELEANGFELVERLPLGQALRASAQGRVDFRLRAVRAERAVAAA